MKKSVRGATDGHARETLNRERVARERERHGLVLLLKGGMGDGSRVFGMGKVSCR